ncbi:YihA family ribosome biogenesis GTP-binding protein [Mucilaginibacter rubeus]|uniref:Probable GTP-binding protein EngB n=1 Tax=Mucilaginibacter rubeus TaxID=2027860 RepID=A0AAE6MJA2_9SPHI|nr:MULTISPECIES: ribosome biogenesis GTP-binding protein YihA/YsxC [Mucilaginibacter]QEM05406.1 YihA family ribosome biogenesis GTP-binding protein [Mucilaginibacter rubeus]QEM17992.1 YihA family ribosome biogenesis GTP-binding protein [Mucilaginibacter gossypii]QTE45473.1 YihA family ribosome biogenesis GTP-binding protein [Mucilaginibacter rubeus]QTE52070.1 YihA family ribosome biogenesis GTP-binding protein [Mucilaginibacter rubeus]QTE57158.1 YihA family ribosome biogenesis GTP-binding prot
MIVKSAEFICSNSQVSKLPPPVKAEYAFIGRSNVGKSSLINTLTGKKGLAKTSQTPGKTQLINHFLINEGWYIVDLPGYGYARASKTEKAKWDKFIHTYLDKRESLQCVMVLIDSRLEPQKIDLEFCNWLGEKGLSFVLVFTKADKQSSIKTDQSIAKFRKALLATFDEMPQFFITSSETQQGREEILEFIDAVNQNFEVPQFFSSPLENNKQ